MKNFYITTAIDYANGSPHLGHAYEKVITDVVARYRRAMGESVTFLTGLDEHGQKVQQSATARGITPLEFCNEVAEKFIGLCEKLHISNTDYIRTTQDRHQQVVKDILQDLFDRDLIYKADYQGYYSVRAEQFLQEKDKVNDQWPAEYGEVIEITEGNYFFRLSQYQDWLVDYLKENEKFIFPRFRLNQVLEFLKSPINDLCISRPKERLQWGIELPFDAGYVTYVWFDALINYISAIGYGTADFDKHWPADFHVIGKDIMLPPHAVYWPIMLKAANIPLPKSLLVHGFWMLDGEKMSKSTGQVMNPLELIDQYGADSFRYFVTREMNLGQDSNFSIDLYLRRYSGELANDLGNLVSRLLNMVGRYLEGKIPAPTIDEEPEQTLRAAWEPAREEVLDMYKGFQFHVGLEKTFGFIKNINRYAEARQPWMLAKSEDARDQELLRTSLFYMAEGLRLANALLLPVMPSTVDKIQGLLGLPTFTTWEGQLDWDERLVDNEMGEKTILFPRPQK